MINRRASTVVLTLGYVALTIALLAAHRSPATGYEVSIYTATPPLYWIGAGVTAVTSIATLAYERRRTRFTLAFVLFVMAVGSFIFLPTIRSYFAYGQGDALTHLGWLQQIVSGAWSGFELVYPGTHVTTALVGAATGLSTTRSMLLVFELFAIGSVVFLPVAVRAVLNDRTAIAIATVLGGMLLPVTNLSTYLDFHPFTMTAFYFPFVLFLTFLYLRSSGGGSIMAVLGSRLGVLLILTLFAVVLLHPQVALNVFILLGTISVVQLLAHRLPSTTGMDRGRLLLVPTALSLILFAVWALRFNKVLRMFGYVTEAVGSFWTSAGDTTGQNVQQQGGSLSEIGVSLFEVLLRMLGVQLLFTVLAGAIVLWAVAGKLGGTRTERNAVVGYFTYGGLVLTPFFLLHFLGDISTYFFRHVGFAMVIAAVLATFAIHAVADRLSGGTAYQLAKPLGVAVGIALLGIALLSVYPSPLIYQATPGVPQSEMVGHDIAFETTGEGVPYTGVRQGPGRYEDALNADVPSADSINGTAMAENRLVEARDGPYYLIVSQYDRGVEVQGFRGIDYGREALDSVGNETGVSRIQAADGFTRYYVAAGADAPTNASAPADADPNSNRTASGNASVTNRTNVTANGSDGPALDVPTVDRIA
jgi:hypothetical protein